MSRSPGPSDRFGSVGGTTRAFAVTAGLTALALLSSIAPAHAGAGPPKRHDEQITWQGWSSYPDWRGGTHDGTVAAPGARPNLTLRRPVGTTEYADPHTGITRSWQYATWTSPVTRVGFDASELVASWNAETPAGTWIQIEMQGTYNTGDQTPWYVLGRWASGDSDIRADQRQRQGDPWSTIWTDTFSIDDVADGVLLRAYQLRLTLYRAPGQTRRAPGLAGRGDELERAGPVRDHAQRRPDRLGHGSWPCPRYSQNVHSGHYPEYDGGGEAWCSPTSTEMVVEYWRRGPSAADTAWVDPAYADPTVDHAARMAFDYAYDGAGQLAVQHRVRRLLPRTWRRGSPGCTRWTRLEHFIRAGIPVVTSQSFLASELDGANYGTAGHLFVVVGFTAEGNVIVNDPASSSNEVVRNVYQREQFEQIWLRTKRINASGGVSGGSGGIAYLIKPRSKPWPKVPGSTNW